MAGGAGQYREEYLRKPPKKLLNTRDQLHKLIGFTDQLSPQGPPTEMTVDRGTGQPAGDQQAEEILGSGPWAPVNLKCVHGAVTPPCCGQGRIGKWSYFFANPMELSEVFYRLKTNRGMTHRQIAYDLKVSKTMVSVFLSLRDLHPDVQSFIAKGDLAPTNAYHLRVITNPEDQVRFATDAVRKGTSEAKMKASVAAYLRRQKTKKTG